MAIFKAILLFFLAAAHCSFALFVEERGSNVCSSGIYGELAPILAQYQIAQQFCSAAYPVSCTPRLAKRRPATLTTTTTTTTKTTKPSAPTTTKSTTTTKPSSTTTAKSPTSTAKSPTTTTKSPTSTTKSSTTTAVDAKSSAWSKCRQQPGNVISTLCSCIEVPTACKSSTTKTTTTSSTSTTTTT
ncbi:hypothetical protein H2200_012121, partial [Cladophialophora chaetospira]